MASRRVCYGSVHAANEDVRFAETQETALTVSDPISPNEAALQILKQSGSVEQSRDLGFFFYPSKHCYK
jgi:hypothetical protein